MHQRGAVMGKALERIGQADHQQVGLGMRVKKVAACRQRHMGAVIAAHAVNSQCDHGVRFWPLDGPGEAFEHA